jgi:hypothetical protein
MKESRSAHGISEKLSKAEYMYHLVISKQKNRHSVQLRDVRYNLLL